MSLDSKPLKTNIFKELSKNFDNFNLNKNFLKNDISQYQIKGRIGEGMFGKVKLGIHLLTREKVAIKIFDKGKIKNEKESDYINREISILKKLNHYNIIKLYNIIQEENFVYLIQEYISNGELLNFLENPENKNITEQTICKLYQQLISGIEYLYEIGIAHRDLKLENILLNYNNDIKIIDFGLSNKYNKDNEELLWSSCGSPCYAAPEMIKGDKYHGVDTDIWSSGIILYLMLCKSFPFNDRNNSKLYQKILSGKFILPNYLSNDAKDLLIKLLKVNPDERIKLNEIKKHPWFNLINPKYNYNKGIDITKRIMPLDEDIIKDMKKFGIDCNIIIDNILNNYFNNITTTYNLLLKKKIKEGKKSVADLCSDLFIEYYNDEKNKLNYFNNDIDLIIKNRINIILFDNRISNNKNKNKKNDYLYNKKIINQNKKILYQKNENISNRKFINFFLNLPIKSHTIDHLSKSNSKKKENYKVYKSPNLTRFNTRKYLKNNQNNINTIKNKTKMNTNNTNDIFIVIPHIDIKKIFNKNKKGNITAFRSNMFNKSLDNKYIKDKFNNSNGIINYYNKINNSKEAKKRIFRTIENKRRTDSKKSYSPINTISIINDQKYIDNSLLINSYSIKSNGYSQKSNLTQLNKKKKSKEDKINISNNKNKINNSNLKHNNYVVNKNIKIKKNFLNGFNFNNNSIDGKYNIKRNNYFFEKLNFKKINKNKIKYSLSQQKEQKDIITNKTKKESSFSIDLNLRNNKKNEFILTNRLKRKNVMKFVNKNNMNLKVNKYDYGFKNENKRFNNKILDIKN